MIRPQAITGSHRKSPVELGAGRYLLPGIASVPVRGQSYFRAEIIAGRVGPDQTPPTRELD